jgi:hypothetical protein
MESSIVLRRGQNQADIEKVQASRQSLGQILFSSAELVNFTATCNYKTQMQPTNLCGAVILSVSYSTTICQNIANRRLVELYQIGPKDTSFSMARTRTVKQFEEASEPLRASDTPYDAKVRNLTDHNCVIC